MSKISNLIFHNKKHYITQNFSDKHKATDYGTHRKKINQYAIEDGIVTWTGLISGGKTVKIKYPRINKEFLHLHLDKIKVKKGQKVNKNTVLGTTGMTGLATGIHLHLRIKDLSTNKIEEVKNLISEKQIKYIYITNSKINNTITKLIESDRYSFEELTTLVKQYRKKYTGNLENYLESSSEYISTEQYNAMSELAKEEYEWTPFYNSCLIGIKYKIDFYYDYS